MTRICQTCQRSFVSTHGRLYCSGVCRGEVKILTCMTCEQSFLSRHGGRRYCSAECKSAPRAPAVYRFICPDGRSYVGSVKDCRKRADNGIQRSNSRLLAAFDQYPSETWTYGVLERLPPGCSERKLRRAEQRHIRRLRSWDPKYGFNIYPAVWNQRAVRQRQQERILRTRN